LFLAAGPAVLNGRALLWKMNLVLREYMAEGRRAGDEQRRRENRADRPPRAMSRIRDPGRQVRDSESVACR